MLVKGTNGKINGNNTIEYLFNSDAYDNGSPAAQAMLPDMDGTYYWDSTTHSWHQ